MFALGDLCRQLMVGDPLEADTAIACGIIRNLDKLEYFSIEAVAAFAGTSVSTVKRFIRELRFPDFNSFVEKLKSEYMFNDAKKWEQSLMKGPTQEYDLRLVAPEDTLTVVAEELTRAPEVFLFNDTVHPVSNVMVDCIINRTPCYNFIALSAQDKMLNMVNRDSFVLFFHSGASDDLVNFENRLESLRQKGCKICVVTEAGLGGAAAECDYKLLLDVKYTIDHFHYFMLVDLKLAHLMFEARQRHGTERIDKINENT